MKNWSRTSNIQLLRVQERKRARVKVRARERETEKKERKRVKGGMKEIMKENGREDIFLMEDNGINVIIKQ